MKDFVEEKADNGLTAPQHFQKDGRSIKAASASVSVDPPKPSVLSFVPIRLD